MSMKMAPTGGPAIGVTWDDGAHSNVREIQISHDVFGINFVKIDEYIDAKKTETGERYFKIGDESHGKKSYHPSHVTEEFQLQSYEYITEVETYVRFSDNAVGNVMMFIFKTNQRTSKAYGVAPSADREYKTNKKLLGSMEILENVFFMQLVSMSVHKTYGYNLTQRFYKYSSD